MKLYDYAVIEKPVIALSFMFLMTWTLGGLWVLVTLCAALAAITSSNKLDLGVLGILGIVLWCLGFVIEVVADHQKTQFRKASYCTLFHVFNHDPTLNWVERF